MPLLRIDNREIEVPSGSTILDAARELGLDIPSLCFLEGCRPSTSCMVCLVKVRNGNSSRIVPSCATMVEDGMQVESETEEVHRIRRTGLELLLSDHVGDCTAPCQNTCPAHMDIPLMLQQVGQGRLRDAIATIKSDIALPAVLGRVCPELCEKGCRRGQIDSPAAICQVKRYVADVDLASDAPYLPPCQPSTGKHVAVVGTGPAGLAAAFHLLQQGHACTLFDERDKPGGMLRSDFDETQLPRSVLDAEIAVIERLGARFRMGIAIGQDVKFDELPGAFDAALIAINGVLPMDPPEAGPSTSNSPHARIETNRQTCETSVPGVFATPDAVKPGKVVIRSVAQGKDAAICIHQYLQGLPVTGPPSSFTVRAGRMCGEELVQLAIGAGDAGRTTLEGASSADSTDDDVRAEALRCLHCECVCQDNCRLRHYAHMYGARTSRFRGERRPFERHVRPLRDGIDIVYEPGKCILCGLCVQIAEKAEEPLGLTFIGRGFNVRVQVPFDGSIAEGLTLVAKRCVDACPTAALALRTEDPQHL